MDQRDHQQFSEQVAATCQGKLLEYEPMKKHTTWRVGGPARYFYRPKDLEDLAKFIKIVPKELPIIWLGLGSNVLVRDGGIDGVVIAHQGALKQLTSIDAVTVRAEAGLACAQVARAISRLSLQGAEFLAGVPGTMGGALAMNAGCFGSETWNHVVAVETLNRQGEIKVRPASDFHYEYRYVKRPADEWFVAGHLKLTPGDKDQSLEKIRELLDKRAATQPTGKPTGGSSFRNPPGDFSARLIEACELKGFSLGGASVSEKHANFIISDSDACAQDIEDLMGYVAGKVEEKFNIKLIPEVHFLGQKASISEMDA